METNTIGEKTIGQRHISHPLRLFPTRSLHKAGRRTRNTKGFFLFDKNQI